MIKILIIEDEIPATKKLRRFVEELSQPTEIVAEIDTVDESIFFLKNNKVDLIFSDIELKDGNSFEVYSQVAITCPIIFTTAYSQYLMDAFDSNGIDYLLKPFSKERFQKAWNKFCNFSNTNQQNNDTIARISKLLDQNINQKVFKKRFTIHNHKSIYFLETENISFFEANEGIIFAYDCFEKRHILNIVTLKELEELLSPTDFFRINRSEIVNKLHIEKIEYYTKNNISIKLKNNYKILITSQQNTATFRNWIEQ